MDLTCIKQILMLEQFYVYTNSKFYDYIKKFAYENVSAYSNKPDPGLTLRLRSTA